MVNQSNSPKIQCSITNLQAADSHDFDSSSPTLNGLALMILLLQFLNQLTLIQYLQNIMFPIVFDASESLKANFYSVPQILSRSIRKRSAPEHLKY